MAWTEKYCSASAPGGGNGSSGNPWTLAEGLAALAAGTRLNLLAGTYSQSAGITIATIGPWIIQGYTSTPGDGGRATLAFGTTAADGVTVSGALGILRDLTISSTATTGAWDGLRLNGGNAIVERVCCYGWRENGFEVTTAGGDTTFIECEAYDCNKAGTAVKAGFAAIAAATFLRCISHDINALDADGHGFYLAGSSIRYTLSRCIAETCGGIGFFIAHRTLISVLSHCEAYNNAQGGFVTDQNTYIPCTYLENCNAIDNGVANYKTVQAASAMILSNCTSKGTRLSDAGKILDESSSLTFANSPYVDAANGNFGLHATNGAAAIDAARASFLQSQGYSGSTSSQLDIGAARHTEPTDAEIATAVWAYGNRTTT